MRKHLLTLFSMLLIAGFTVAANAQLLPPENLTATAGDGFVQLAWDEPGGEPPPDLIMLRQHSNVATNAYYQQYDRGYGVIFDLDDYPGATLEYVDFRHSPWGINGTWQYKIHIIDWTNYNTLAVIGPLNTTVNNGWELDIDLGSIVGNDDLVGILIEPMSNSSTDAYPCIDGDDDMQGYSVNASLTNLAGYTISSVGDFLIDLWIAPADSREAVRAERVMVTANQMESQPVRIAGNGFTSYNHIMTQMSFPRELIGYNIYRDQEMINVDPHLLTEYTDNDVENDVTYSYYVTAVYTEGESEPSNTVEATPQGTPSIYPPPLNLTASLVGDDSVLLNWDAPEFGSWFYWGSGENPIDNGIGTGQAAVFAVAQRFTPDNIADLGIANQFLTTVRLWPRVAGATYTVKVWRGGSSNPWNAGELLYSEVATGLTMSQWNDYELSDPVQILADQEIWFGYEVDTPSGHPAGCDDGPAIDGYGNMMYWQNAWDTLIGIAPTLDYNWCLQGFASYASGRELTPIVHTRSANPGRGENVNLTSEFTDSQPMPVIRNSRLTGYRVYRNGVDIADVEETTYLDEGLEPGVYQYYVTSVFGDEESDPSNVVVVNTQVSTILFDDFEGHPDFALLFPPWTLIDLDQSPTYGFTEIDFPNSGSAMAYIIFNPSQTTPPMDLQAYSGDKMAASFAATQPPNNDWMITPQIELGENSSLSFWARSYTAQYGLERMKVGVSTTSMLPATFTIISEDPYIEVPVDWTEYTFDLSQWDNQNVWLAINCVSNDAFILFIDDFHVQGITEVSVEDDYAATPVVNTRLLGNYPNPFNPETTISFALEQDGPVSIEVFNIKGQRIATVLNDYLEAGTHNVVWNGKTDQNREAGSGIYFYRMKSGRYSSTRKMIMMK